MMPDWNELEIGVSRERVAVGPSSKRSRTCGLAYGYSPSPIKDPSNMVGAECSLFLERKQHFSFSAIIQPGGGPCMRLPRDEH